MRRYLGIILTVVIVLVVLIGLNAISLVSVERTPESESDPLRSSYNVGPTGTRAFYQLLEESGYQVARWRDNFAALERAARGASLIIVGPFQAMQDLPAKEAEALRQWIAAGGEALVISRTPHAQFGDATISEKSPAVVSGSDSNPDQIVDERSDVLIVQPTALTRDIRGLAISRFASRIKFQSAQISGSQQAQTGPESKEPGPGGEEAKDLPQGAAEGPEAKLEAPVIHLGDSDGAALADFNYGQGRVIFLSDPFVIANNGIMRGSNLMLALNLVQALGGRHRRIFFDEYHHGYYSESNPLLVYFSGTSVPWVLGQALLLAALIAYSYGRRFARPLPLPQVDRHSPLEFVGSMANLQQVAHARDLALENIYPRFKARLCRALGVSVRAQPEEIAAHLNRRRLGLSETELYQTLVASERALAGEQLDDQRLISLVSAMRRISAQLR